jgi:hypothetical protein
MQQHSTQMSYIVFDSDGPNQSATRIRMIATQYRLVSNGFAAAKALDFRPMHWRSLTRYSRRRKRADICPGTNDLYILSNDSEGEGEGATSFDT